MSHTISLSLACIAILAIVSPTNSARILGLFITDTKSHLIVHSAITDALAERGHNATVVTTIPLIRPNPLYRHIQLDVPRFPSNFFTELVGATSLYKRVTDFMDTITNHANDSLNHPKMRTLMEEESFDLVIYGHFLNDFLLGVSGRFKCPVVVSFTIRPFSALNRMIGNPRELSYVPTMISNAMQPLTFFGRMANLLLGLLEDGVMNVLLESYMTKFYNSNFPPDKYPSLSDMKKNISLVLTNHHFSQTPIRPNVPGLIEIGGIQVKDKPDPLPESLKTILDNSKNNGGTIYFSLGSNIQGSNLDASKAKIMFDVLSKLPQTVLWKWGESGFPGESPNIIYQSWLPQDDILAHPNVKLFITHGGQGSVVESQYHGVPMVGIPLFAEQSKNMANVEREGFGLALDYQSLSEDGLRNAVNEVLLNSQYRENVQRFAKLYKDRPMSAKETAVFWVEYVLRHHGAPHMQSPAVHLNGFQLMSLDVIAFLVVVVYVVFKVIKVTFSLIFRRKSPKNKTKNKKE